MNPWQEIVPLERLNDVLPEEINIFICSASYEERCKSIAKSLAARTHAVERSLICFNQKSVAEVTKNVASLENLLGPSATRVPLSKNDPLFSADNIQKELSRFARHGAVRYLIDITTFTHESLLILLKILRPMLLGQNRAVLAYATAAEYAVGLKDEEK